MSSFTAKNILVIGDVMTDEYWSGPVNRISPEAPVPIVDVKTVSMIPGAAANVAINVNSLGVKTSLVGVVGNDIQGKAIKKIMKEKNINSYFSTIKNVNTIRKLRVTSNKNQLIRLDFEDDKSKYKISPNPKIFNLIKNSSVVIFSDYNKGALDAVQNLIKKCNQYNIPTVVDPKGDSFTKYRNSTIITPNFNEFCNIVGPIKNEKDLIKKGQLLKNDLNLKALLITRGEDGMTLIDDKNSFNFEAISRDIFDVTGAGDTVAACLAVCLGSGYDLISSARIANFAASKVVLKPGTASVIFSEIEEQLFN